MFSDNLRGNSHAPNVIDIAGQSKLDVDTSGVPDTDERFESLESEIRTILNAASPFVFFDLSERDKPG
jgi:hypothetical protein